MNSLVSDFLSPEIAPEDYSPAPNVVAWRALMDGEIVLEVFKRSNGTYGYQYQAWVAWRDAGDEVNGHGWHTISPKSELVSDNILETRDLAVSNSESLGLTFYAEWKSAV